MGTCYKKEIRKSDYCVCLLSKKVLIRRGFIHIEIKRALEIADEYPENIIFLIPVRLEKCDLPYERLRDFNYIDFFPNRDEGYNKLLGSLKIKTTIKDELQKYEYRCGLVDLDVGLTNLTAIAKKLNSLQRYFHFTCPKLSLTNKPLQKIDGIINLNIDDIPIDFYTKEKYMSVDLIVCITKYPLAFQRHGYLYSHHFSGPSNIDKRYMFISTNFLYDQTKTANCTFEKGIIHIITGQLIVYFTNYGYHVNTEGCIMDYCENYDDRILGLQKSHLCPECYNNITNIEFRESISAILSDDIIV